MTKFDIMNYLDIRLDANEMDHRLKARLSPWELFGVALCFSMIGIYVWLMKIHMGYPVDFEIYMNVEATTGLYYGAWITPFFNLLKFLPFTTAYVIFSIINVLCALFTVRVLGGKPIFVLVGFQLFSTLYYGQMSGILAAGIALCWWGLAHRRWNICGLGMILAMTKYQVGLFWCLLMIWYVGVSLRNFLRILVVPALIGVITLIIYPLWPLKVATNLSVFPNIPLGITLWIYMGAWCLLFWIPGFFLPMSRKERFFVFISLLTLAVPYYQHIDLLTLAALPIGWLPLILQVAFFRGLWGFTPIRLTALLPGLIYCAIVIPAGYRAAKDWIVTLKKNRSAPTGML